MYFSLQVTITKNDTKSFKCVKISHKCQDPVFCCSRVCCFIVKMLPSCVPSCFSVPPSLCFSLTCPSPASLHLYLIHSLFQYVVFVLNRVFGTSFRVFPWCRPVFPTSTISCVSLWYVSVFMLLESSFDLYSAFVLHILEALFCCYFVFCPWDLS